MAVPTLDSKLVPFSTNFHTRVAASPATFDLEASDVAELTAVYEPYIAAAEAAESPGAKSRSLLLIREAAKKALLPVLRQLYARVQVSPNVSDSDKTLLGIALRRHPVPRPIPATAPVLEIGPRFATTVTVHLHEAEGGSSRAKPAGVATATLFSYVGATPPANLEGWRYVGSFGRTTVQVTFPSETAPGTTVWFCAFWSNAKGQSGPVCAPVSAIIAGGGLAKMAA